MNILKGFLKITYQLTDQFGTFIHFRIAGLPVKVISGFSKGCGYSAENPFTPMTKHKDRSCMERGTRGRTLAVR